MFKSLKIKFLTELIGMVLGLLDGPMMKKAADKMLDFFEDLVEDSENTLDDKLVLPMINKVRETFGIPDGDE